MEWVTPVELKKALIRPGMQAEELVNMVSARAAHGLLRTKAKHLIDDVDEFGDCEIPREFWSGGWFCFSGDWDVGDLIATLPRDTRGHRFKKIKAFGILFSREDAEAMGAVFNAPELTSGLPVAIQIQPDRPETVEAWAIRMADRGVRIKGFTGAVLRASWEGSTETLPLVKDAEGALLAEWIKRGEGTRGRQPKDKGLK